MAKPKFALYTGTESVEEKEIIRNIFNSTWKYVPSTLIPDLEQMNSNNFMGEIIKVFMITASGAEGITLKNVRHVHITEPYWHPVRTQQVIGRARRICSHNDLPEDLRTVDVYMYLMKFSKIQMESDYSIELRNKDKSKVDKATPYTTDQSLFEISSLKEEITKKLLLAIKQSAMDCAIHSDVNSSEQLACFSFSSTNPESFSYIPSLSAEQTDSSDDSNKTRVTWKAQVVKIKGISYAINKETMEVYDLQSYKDFVKTKGKVPLVYKGVLKKVGGEWELL